MLIEKVTLIDFDEATDRQRIMRSCKGAQLEALLAIMDAFVAGDFAKTYHLARATNSNWLGYLAIPVSDVLHEIHDQIVKKAAAARGLKLSRADQKRLAQRGVPFGPEALNYPKFIVRLDGGEPAPATVPQLADL